MIFHRYSTLLVSFFFLISCTYYSFKGSIPSHIKSINIKPLINNTIESGVSDILKGHLEELIIKDNVLKILSSENSDSFLNITVTSFSDQPYSYNIDNYQITGYEEVNEYRITIKVRASWIDTLGKDPLFDLEFISWGAYDPDQDISSDGIDNDNDTFIDELDDDEFGLPRESAIRIASKKICESIINKIVSTW